MAENPCKCDQYVTSDEVPTGLGAMFNGANRELHDAMYATSGTKPPKGEVYYLVLVRVVMGYYAKTKDGKRLLDSSKSLWSSHQRELALVPGGVQVPFHSLVAECGPSREGYQVVRHREFMQFKSSRLCEWAVARKATLAARQHARAPMSRLT